MNHHTRTGNRRHGKTPKVRPLREGTNSNLEGKRSTHQRCPKCKQLRRKYILANHMYDGRKLWERIEEGKSKVCHICVARHRGEELPIVHAGLRFKPKRKKQPREQPPKS